MDWRRFSPLVYIVLVVYIADSTEACNCTQPPPCLSVNRQPIKFPEIENQNSVGDKTSDIPFLSISCPMTGPFVSLGPLPLDSRFYYHGYPGVCVDTNDTYPAASPVSDEIMRCTAVEIVYDESSTNKTEGDAVHLFTQCPVSDTTPLPGMTPGHGCRNCGWIVLLFIPIFLIIILVVRRRRKSKRWVISHISSDETEDSKANKPLEPNGSSKKNPTNTTTTTSPKNKDTSTEKSSPMCIPNPSYEGNEKDPADDGGSAKTQKTSNNKQTDQRKVSKGGNGDKGSSNDAKKKKSSPAKNDAKTRKQSDAKK